MVFKKEIMKNTELRIGNLVECFGTREVIAIKKHKIKVQHEKSEGHFILEWCPINSLSLKPIPLTKEWLLKLGFFKYNNAYVLEKPTENIMNFKFSIWNDFTYNSSEFPIELKYVHQLQNLYFALTGSELTVA